MALPINIEDLLNRRKIESNRIEFKKGWNPTDIYRSIGAFANDFDNLGGGYILVGVEEKNGVAQRPVTGINPTAVYGIMKQMNAPVNATANATANAPVNVPANVPANVLVNVPVCTPITLIKTQERIMKLLKGKGSLTFEEMAKELKVTRKTIQRNIA